MRQRIPGVTTMACPADDLPYADGPFNAVCSQFGVEYAGTKAFEEAAHVLAPNGRLLILCHYSNGYIDSRNSAKCVPRTLKKHDLPLAWELTATR